MAENPAEDLAFHAGEWVSRWVHTLADGTTLTDSGIRFTPGMLHTMHQQIAALSRDELSWLLTAALTHGAALEMKERGL